jgi:ABC-type amino acid transport system permease subunit
MFLNAVFLFLSVVTLLGALLPIALALDRAITAFKSQKKFWPWVCIAVLCIVISLITAFLSAASLLLGLLPSFVFNLNGGNLLPALLAAIWTLAGPWSVWLIGKRWLSER